MTSRNWSWLAGDLRIAGARQCLLTQSAGGPLSGSPVHCGQQLEPQEPRQQEEGRRTQAVGGQLSQWHSEVQPGPLQGLPFHQGMLIFKREFSGQVSDVNGNETLEKHFM